MKNINPEEIKKAAENGQIESYINKNLPPDASKRVKQILSDKSATEKLLNTPEAKALMQKFMKK